ncbi:hypothetical protein [Tsukamurella sp. NPDC003166]|uniref:hypothetical protein n=1 Tax=Tsukamurella sp. NPDC003166 TaxID=3154444 RepID=UPI00339FE889
MTIDHGRSAHQEREARQGADRREHRGEGGPAVRDVFDVHALVGLVGGGPAEAEVGGDGLGGRFGGDPG